MNGKGKSLNINFVINNNNNMATLSVSIPDKLKWQMKKLDDVNWSAVARQAFEERVEQIMFLKKLANKSKLTKKDAKELADKINRKAAKKFLEL